MILASFLRPLLSVSGVLSVVVLSSCSRSAPPTPFVDGVPAMSRDKTTSFQRSWVKPGVSLKDYHKVYVAPTVTEYAEVKWNAYNTRGLFTKNYDDDVKDEGVYFQQAFASAFTNSKGRDWEVLQQASRGVNTLKVEAAIVQLTPSRVSLEVVGYLIPVVGALNRIASATEVKISDAKTGELLAVYADRQGTPASPIDLAKLRYYRPHQNIVRNWGRETVQWIEREDPKKKIYGPLRFQPVTW